jgi:ParB/RepB/Spo0J family partition protein
MANTILDKISTRSSDRYFDISSVALNPDNFRVKYGKLSCEMAYEIVNTKILSDNLKNNITTLLEAERKEFEGSLQYPETLEFLVRSVLNDGIKTTIEVYLGTDEYDHTAIVTMGNRRILAANIANKVFGGNLQKVSAKILKIVSQEEIIKSQFLENSAREGNSKYELALMIKALMGSFAGDSKNVAKFLGIQHQFVKQCLGVLALSPEAQTAIANGDVAFYAASQAIGDISASENVTSPLEVSQIVSDAILLASTEAKSKGKSKASKSDIVARVRSPKILPEKDVMVDEVHVLASSKDLLESMTPEDLNKALKIFKKYL